MSVSVACIGAGYFAQFHHDGWRRAQRAELVAVCDHDLARAEASGVAVYRNAKTMLAEISPDIVDIATPPNTHAEMVTLALEHAPCAIICQKPFAASLDEARSLTARAEAAGVPLIIHENFRFQPWYRTIKSQIEQGAIGAVQQVTFRLRTGDGQGPEAYLDRQPYFQTMPRLLIHETGVHFIDVFRYLLGEATAVYGDLRKLNPAITGEDAGYFLLDHASGARTLFDGNRLLDHDAENHRTTLGEALVEGLTGTLHLTGDGAVGLRQFGETSQRCVLEPQNWPGFGGDCVAALCAHVVSALLDGAPFENEARTYLPVLEISEAIYRSNQEGCKIDL